MNTPPTDLPDEIHPRIRWGWLVYVILCNGILLLTFALPLTKSFLGWFELLFLITISVGGILYALNRTFLQKWFWNIVFWLIVLHFLLLNYLYWGSILNTSLLDVLFVGVLFIPNAYLTFKYAHRDKIKSENVPPDKQTPQNRWVRIIFLVITLIVIMLSFLSVLKFFDSQDTLPLEEQYEKIQTKLYERGLMYQRGKGVPKDDKQAAMLYRKAAEQGNIEAQSALASMYANGEGVPQDDKQAAMWFKKSAEQGDAYSQYVLGVIYTQGKGVPKDNKQAEKWYRRAAEQGDPFSQFKLGVLLEDDKQSAKWFKKSAMQGNAKAEFFLGLLYYEGKGVPQDYKQAIKWYKNSAKKGHADAQYLLGLMYYAGKGEPKNNKQAMMWFQKSADQGNAPAQNFIIAIDKSTDPNKLTAIVDMLTVTKQWLTTECQKKGYVPITGQGVTCKGSFKELFSCLANYNEKSSRNMSCNELDSKISLCEPDILKIAPKESNSKDSQLFTVKFLECVIK